MPARQNQNLFRKYAELLLKEEVFAKKAKEAYYKEKEVYPKHKVEKVIPTRKESMSKENDKIIKKKIKMLLQLNHKGNVFTCQACKKNSAMFSCINHTTFEEHIKIHPEYRPFTCNICPDMFRRETTLTNHIKKYHYGVLLNN